MNITKEEVQQVLDALSPYCDGDRPECGATYWDMATKATALLQSKLEECQHGVDDGACKECYQNETQAVTKDAIIHGTGIMQGGKRIDPLSVYKDGVEHWSDCAVHNMPAYPNGPCDCGAEPVAYWDGGDYVSLSNKGDAKIPLYTKENI